MARCGMAASIASAPDVAVRRPAFSQALAHSFARAGPPTARSARRPRAAAPRPRRGPGRTRGARAVAAAGPSTGRARRARRGDAPSARSPARPPRAARAPRRRAPGYGARRLHRCGHRSSFDLLGLPGAGLHAPCRRAYPCRVPTAANDAIEIVTFDDRHAAAFDRLNRAWLELHGLLEEADEHHLRNPRGTIVDGGGEIFLAVRNSE